MSDPVTSMEGLAQKFKSARLASRLTQEEVAERAGVSSRTIRRIECEFILSPPVMWKLLDALHLDMIIKLEPRK